MSLCLTSRPRSVPSRLAVIAFLAVTVSACSSNAVKTTATSATVTALRTYGTGPLRFEANFPSSVAQPRVDVPAKGTLFVTTCSKQEVFWVTGMNWAVLPINGNIIDGNIAMGPRPCWLEKQVQFWPGSHGKRISTTSGSYQIVRTSLICRTFKLTNGSKRHLCQFEEFVTRHSLDWTVTVYAPTQRIVEQFTNSFRPLPPSKS